MNHTYVSKGCDQLSERKSWSLESREAGTPIQIEEEGTPSLKKGLLSRELKYPDVSRDNTSEKHGYKVREREETGAEGTGTEEGCSSYLLLPDCPRTSQLKQKTSYYTSGLRGSESHAGLSWVNILSLWHVLKRSPVVFSRQRGWFGESKMASLPHLAPRG